MDANKPRGKKGAFFIILLAFGLMIAAIALISIPTSIEQKEIQTESFLLYDGTTHPSTLEPLQGAYPLAFSGVPNSTVFQIEIDCNATIVIRFFDLNFLPFNETEDFLMQKEVHAGNSTSYWTPIYGWAETREPQGYSIEITALENTAAVKAKITRFSYQEVSVNKTVYKSIIEPYFGYIGLVLVGIAAVAYWKSTRVLG